MISNWTICKKLIEEHRWMVEDAYDKIPTFTKKIEASPYHIRKGFGLMGPILDFVMLEYNVVN